jgi:hypothetical protein
MFLRANGLVAAEQEQLVYLAGITRELEPHVLRMVVSAERR